MRSDEEYVRGTRPGVNTDLQTGSKVKDSKPATYAKLQNELDPLHEDFHVMTMAETRARLDKIREQAKKSEQKRTLTTNTLSTQTTPIPTPRQTPTVTPRNSPNIVLNPPRYIDPTTLSPAYIEPASGVSTARQSGIQQRDGVLTRNLRLRTGEPHTQLEGTTANRRGRKKSQLQIQTQLSSRNTNPFSGSDGSVSESHLTERQIAREARRTRSTMLSQTLTPETNLNVAKSGNKSN